MIEVTLIRIGTEELFTRCSCFGLASLLRPEDRDAHADAMQSHTGFQTEQCRNMVIELQI